MFKICFFVPHKFAHQVKEAMFMAGAGKIGHYECCSWETSGTGQFKPLEGSQPFLGEANRLEQVSELKVEMVCDEKCLQGAVAALKATHPYETPAYEVYQLFDL